MCKSDEQCWCQNKYRKMVEIKRLAPNRPDAKMSVFVPSIYFLPFFLHTFPKYEIMQIPSG